MYITCQKCDTVFRLDERLLKPAGSKVRCSQCGNIFVAVPPAPAEVELEPSLEDALWTDEPRFDPAESRKESLADASSAAAAISAPAPEAKATSQEGTKDTPRDAGDQQIEIDFDAEFDFDTPARESSEPESEQDILDELDLGSDFTLDDEKPLSAGTAEARSAPEPIEPSLDTELQGLFLDDEKPNASAPQPAANDSSLDEDFAQALKNLDQQMDDSVTLFVEMTDSPDAAIDMDDLDLELELDPEKEPHAMESPAVTVQPETDNDLDLNLDLEEELQLDLDGLATPAAGEGEPVPTKETGGGDELNFADLDALLETGDDGPATEDRPEEELSLDPGQDKASPAIPEGKEELEELTLELDTEYKEKHLESGQAKSSSEPMGDEEEIDLSDIELLLEGSAAEPSRPKWAADKQADLSLEGGELDLSDLEAAIEEVVTQPESEPDEVKDEDLELSLPLDSEAPRFESAARNDIDLNLENLGGPGVEEERRPRPETLGDGDMELEFQVEETPSGTEIPAAAALNAGPAPAEAAAPAVMPDIDTIPIAPPSPDDLLEQPRAARAEKKSGGALTALVILIILAAIGFGLYYAVTQMGLNIPYVSDFLKPAEQDPAGVRHLSTPEINSKFIENSQSGRIFVISGKVHNGYPDARTAIRLQGKLFTKGKQLAKTEFMYAGIVIDDQELASAAVADIKKRLDTSPRPQDPATKVLPNQSLPFMVVFSDLPSTSELDEFAVEPVGSMPVK